MRPPMLLVLLCVLLQIPCLTTPAKAQIGQHFRFVDLAPGVWAALHQRGGHAICNAGVIDLGSALVVVDPFLSPAAASQLRLKLDSMIGKPVGYVIYTHHHDDHVRGAQVFPEAVVISSKGTCDMLRTIAVETQEAARKRSETALEEWRSKTIDPGDEMALKEREEWMDYHGAIASSPKGVRLVTPSLTFEGSLTLYGAARRVEIREMGAGHTSHDAMVFLPEDSILFAGDLVFNHYHPWMADGDPIQWLKILDTLSSLPVRLLVPGHGGVGGLEIIQPLKDYLQAIFRMAETYLQSGKSPDSDTSLRIPEPYDRWSLRLFFRPNVIFAHRLISVGK